MSFESSPDERVNRPLTLPETVKGCANLIDAVPLNHMDHPSTLYIPFCRAWPPSQCGSCLIKPPIMKHAQLSKQHRFFRQKNMHDKKQSKRRSDPSPSNWEDFLPHPFDPGRAKGISRPFEDEEIWRLAVPKQARETCRHHVCHHHDDYTWQYDSRLRLADTIQEEGHQRRTQILQLKDFN